MFLLIVLKQSGSGGFDSFNTSHVSINPNDTDIFQVSDRGFNTSHVSINHYYAGSELYTSEFPIHPMFLLIERPPEDKTFSSCVSIHPMFLLINKSKDNC